jgi:hypothetical protein
VSKRGVAALLGAMAIVVAVALGGCGGTDQESTSTAGGSQSAAVTLHSTSMGKADYVRKANQICAEQTGKIAGVVRNAIVSNSAVKVEVILPPVEGMLDKLIALGAPRSEEPVIEAFLTALQEDLERAQAHSSASTQALAKDFKRSGDLAARHELEACELG